MTRIVVTTPTGHVGSHVARLLVAAGVRPCLFLRDPARLPPGLADHVDVVAGDQGDQGDAEAVVAATRGADALFWVDPRDIAEVAAARLLARDWTGRAVQAVHGPADLTFADAAAIVTTATGHPVRAERIADDDLRAALREVGLGPQQVEAVVGMSVGLREGFVAEQPRDLMSTTPSTLGGWAFDVLRPLMVGGS